MSNTILMHNNYIFHSKPPLSMPSIHVHNCKSFFKLHDYSSKSFWAPAPKSPAENNIPKKYLNTSLIVLTLIRYRKIPLICPGHIYGQRKNLMGLYSGSGGLYLKEKDFNLQSVKLTFLSFFQYKARISAFFMSCKI